MCGCEYYYYMFFCRLESLDQMNLPIHATEPEYEMTLPDIEHYKDITTESNLPSMTMEDISRYLASNGKKFEQKYKDLYYEK